MALGPQVANLYPRCCSHSHGLPGRLWPVRLLSLVLWLQVLGPVLASPRASMMSMPCLPLLPKVRLYSVKWHADMLSTEASGSSGQTRDVAACPCALAWLLYLLALCTCETDCSCTALLPNFKDIFRIMVTQETLTPLSGNRAVPALNWY